MAWSNLHSFYVDYFPHYNKTLLVLFQFGIIKEMMPCPKCSKIMHINKDTLLFRCNRVKKSKKSRVNCNVKRSARIGTFFEESHLSIMKILEIVTWFLEINSPRQQLIASNVGITSSSVVEWISFCREVCVHWIMQQSGKIGGTDTSGQPVIVEMDEAKFGKRKYNKSCTIEQQWVFGGFERGSKRCFMVPVTMRDSDTLLDVIKTHIEPGTMIVSSCWEAYDCLDSEGFQDLATNHSMQFVGPDHPSVHTKNGKRSWINTTRGVPRNGKSKDNFVGYLAEYLFKKAHPQLQDRFESYLKAIADLYPGL